MSLLVNRLGSAGGESIVFVSCFGDNGSMFEALGDTHLGATYRLILTDLPGFGHARPLDRPLTLEICAGLIDDLALRENARILVAHSVGSIIASLAASRSGSSIDTVISIEGNLTVADAYFSGSAAQYDDPQTFRTAFLARLDQLAQDSPTVARYRGEVAKANPTSLWELGCDAHRFSEAHVPGEVLAASARKVYYLYNPDNCPQASLEWLDHYPMATTTLPGATHWKMVDQPDLLADKILAALAEETATVRSE